MSITNGELQISECHRDNLCQDCDDPKCWHAGDAVADCFFYHCLYNDEYYEQCDQCIFNPRYLKEEDFNPRNSESN